MIVFLGITALIIAGILGFITTAACLSQSISFRRLCRYVERELKDPPYLYAPKASIILPCKGLDPGFKSNIQRLLDQKYLTGRGEPGFEVIFAVASTDDPAYPVLKEISGECRNPAVKLVVAGYHPDRSQKINNQLCALKEISPESEVLVFVDSDVIARDDFLTHLINRLQDPEIGATTGYRFYVPGKGSWPGLVRALWNRMSAWEMANPRYAFAWGGAMAVRRAVFAEAGIERSWQRAADDDLSLTTAVKRLGLRVHFVPQCLVSSEGDAGVGEIVEWTNRQLILTKVYYPRLWLRAVGRAVLMAVWLLSVGFCLFGLLVYGGHEWLVASLLGLSLLPVEIWFLAKAQKLWASVLGEQQESPEGWFWKSCMAVPIAHLTLPWMTLYSLLTNRIRWRGVTYELVSPEQTVVVA